MEFVYLETQFNFSLKTSTEQNARRMLEKYLEIVFLIAFSEHSVHS